ncbi:MAG TPA: hypothetical protein VMW65_08370 [Chloroflexota bacterium]|nr:hypothetical protein [Chloroflexota bacterium]
MEDAVEHSTARVGLGLWVRRNQTTLELFLAAFFGLIVFPAIYLALGGRDLRLGGRISLVNLVWLVLALVACVIVFRARATLVQLAARAADRLLASLPETAVPAGSSPTPRADTRLAGDAQQEGRVVARGLLDLVILLLIQAILRPPLVGVLSGVASVALVDGVYVVLVVVLAIAILLGVNRAGRPLAERLTWLGLNQFVPTAGFASSSATAAFTVRLATTSSRLTTAARASRSESKQVSEPSAASAAPTVVASETVAAQPAPAVEATVLGPVPESTAPETTLAEPSVPKPPARQSDPGETMVDRHSEAVETVVRSAGAADETRMDGGKDETP